jgi:hypothetical protein
MHKKYRANWEIDHGGDVVAPGTEFSAAPDDPVIQRLVATGTITEVPDEAAPVASAPESTAETKPPIDDSETTAPVPAPPHKTGKGKSK